MIAGIESFRNWFRGTENQWVIIGGTACDILMSDGGLDFRATKDIDLVLIVEALDSNFVKKFWGYIKAGGYQYCNRITGTPRFYRFSHPVSKIYPAMIELFSRRPEMIKIPRDAALTPLPTSDAVSSLSAILLDGDYYEFLKRGKVLIDGISILDAAHLIPFKAKAWLDLSNERTSDSPPDARNIRKHKNDVFRLSELMSPTERVAMPHRVFEDFQRFIHAMEEENIDIKQLGLRGRTKEGILKEFKMVFLEDAF